MLVAPVVPPVVPPPVIPPVAPTVVVPPVMAVTSLVGKITKLKGVLNYRSWAKDMEMCYSVVGC